MDAFEFNKFAAAILLALLVIFGGKTMSNIVFKAHKPEKPGYEIEVADAPDHGADKAAGAPQVPFANLLAKASAEKGKGVAKKCAACHTFNKGGANKIGPNLYGTLDRKLGSAGGFAYSGALKAKGGTWDYEALNQFLASPKAYIKGTKMAFAGVKKDDQRADLILYMREQGDNKPPLPEAKSEAAPEPKAAAKPAPEKPAAMAPEKPAAKPAQEKPAAMAPEKPAMLEPEKPAAMPAPEKPTAMAPEKPAAMTPAVNDTLGARLAKGDASRGKGVSAKCAICHTFESGGKNKIGPNLYGVAGRKVGSVVDFKYSDAIRAKGGTWTFEQLDCLITKPKECVPGTKMPFPGLPDATARGDLLVFLRTLSDNPVPLPAP